MSSLHPMLSYPLPQDIRGYWQKRLETVTARTPENGAIKYASDFFCMIRQQEIKAGASYRSAWAYYPQAPHYCCQVLCVALSTLAHGVELLLDAIKEWSKPAINEEIQDIFGHLYALSLEELQRMKTLYLALQREVFELAIENGLLIVLEGVQIEATAWCVSQPPVVNSYGASA